MLSNANIPEHDWVEYNVAREPRSYPARKPHRLCRNCGVAERLDVNPMCINPGLVFVQSSVQKELR